MTTDPERRLRAALEAGAELITDPPGTADYQPPAASPPGRRRGTRRRRQGPWVAPLLAAAAVVVIVAGVTAIVRTATGHQGTPVSHRSPPAISAPSPAPTSAGARQQPLAGPQVVDAGLFAAGHGYVRTLHALLWTGDYGATWSNITPPGLAPAQLQSAGIAVLPDGHEWVALAGRSTVTVMRRSPAAPGWTSTSVPLGALTILPDASAVTSLSFTDPDHGWLLAGEQITHTGSGELLRTTDGGVTWTRQADQRALPGIGAIRFLSPQVGYLRAASTGAWWTTRDAGQRWTPLQLPVPAAKKSDSVSVIGAPALAGDGVVLAASFTTPAGGSADGVGIYRSTNLGATWTIRPLASETATEQYSFAAAPDGSSLVLLRSQPAPGLQTFTWVATRSTDGGRSFTDAASVHDFYPGTLLLADRGTLWTIGGANGCTTLKADCWSTAGLIASGDGGASWHQVKLPS
jgi:photosystem II stability/assembly factor-like uncharacterized protein